MSEPVIYDMYDHFYSLPCTVLPPLLLLAKTSNVAMAAMVFQYCCLLYTASFQLPWQLFPYLTSWLVVLLQCIQYVCTLHAHTPPPLTPLVHLTEVDVVGLLDK